MRPMSTKSGFNRYDYFAHRQAKRRAACPALPGEPPPSELSWTKACFLQYRGTIFAMRLSNQSDQEFLPAALPESKHGLMGESLFQCGNGCHRQAKACRSLPASASI